jgi:type IV secretory pathway VirB4 component
VTFQKLIKTLHRKMQPKRVRAFRKAIPVKAFIDDVTFIAADGSAGVCLRHTGVDDECLTDKQRESDSEQLWAAQRQFDELDRLYQYAIRRANASITHKEHYENPKVQEINQDRNRHLWEKAHFGSIELYSVALRHGQYKGKRSTDAMIAERQKVCSTIRTKAFTYAEQTATPFGTVVLSKDEAFLFLRKLLNLDASLSDTLRLKRDTGLDMQLPGAVLVWDERSRHLRMGSRHIRVLSIREAGLKSDSGLPVKTLPNLLKEVLAIDSDMIICQQWSRAENPAVRKEVQSKKKHISDFERHGVLAPEATDKKVDELLADQSADVAIKRLGSVLEHIENEGDVYGKFSYTVVLHGDDNAKLDAAIAQINRVWGQFDGALFEEDRGALAAFLSILPGNVRYAVREQWLAHRHFADLSLCYAPYTGSLTASELADGEEYLALLETRDRTPFYWDPFVGGAFGLFGTGKRGRGKTFLANFLVCSAQKYNGHTCILDLGQNYRQTVQHFGGTVVSLSLEDQSFRINPFALPYTADNHQFLFKFLQFLIEADGTELGDEREKVLFEKIGSMYQLDPEDRTLSTFYVNAPGYYKHKLAKWIRGGQYGWVFDNVDDTVSLSRMTCFEFGGVNDYPELVEPLVMWILGRVRAQYFDLSIVHEFKYICCDEVWKFLKNPKILDWLTEMLKFGRNRLVACSMWTQSAEDLGPAKRLVIDNCETVVFLGNPNFDRALYKQDFQFNEHELEIAGKLRGREFLLKTEGYSKVLRLSVTERMRWMFTTRPKEQRRRQLAIAKHGDQALNVLAAM